MPEAQPVREPRSNDPEHELLTVYYDRLGVAIDRSIARVKTGGSIDARLVKEAEKAREAFQNSQPEKKPARVTRDLGAVVSHLAHGNSQVWENMLQGVREAVRVGKCARRCLKKFRTIQRKAQKRN